jgi:hypothetical protein
LRPPFPSLVLSALLALPALPGATEPADEVVGAPEPEMPTSEAGAASPRPALNDDPDFVRRRGVELYERHQASLIALDAAREVGLADVAPLGWITLREDGVLRVRFVGACPEGICALVDVRIDREQLSAESLYPPEPLGETGLRSWRAKERVFASQTATCPTPYNAVVFPPEGDEPRWTVYLVAQPEAPDLVAVGGHMRVFLDPEAETILDAEDFSATCLLLRRPEEADQIAVEYGWATMPAETHVLTSLQHQLVLFVGTAEGVWRVNGDGLERIAGIAPGS